jgi:signal transduction histidine kinase
LRAECAADVGLVNIVPHRIEEMLRNILDNALVQPMERREVVLRAEREGDTVTTTVRDFGPGVSPGNRDKIFRRFFSQRPAGGPPGTGLGLSIVTAVLSAHGGKAWVRDPDEGPGALFVLTMRA